MRGIQKNIFVFSPLIKDKESPEFRADVDFIRSHELERMFIRKRNILFIESCRYASYATKKRWGVDFSYFDYGTEGVLKQVFQTKNLNQEVAELWWQSLQENPAFVNSLVDELSNIVLLDQDLAREVSGGKNSEPAEIMDALQLYLNWFSQFFEIVNPWFALDEMKKRYLEPAFEKLFPDTYKTTLETLLKPIDLPLSSREQRELLQLSRAPEEERESLLLLHHKKYSFLAVHQMEDAPFDLEYYRSRVKALQESGEYEKSKQNLERAEKEINQAKELFRSLELPEDIRALVFLIQSFAFLRTESIDHMMMVYNAFQPVFLKIATLLETTLDEVVFLTFFEIKQALFAKGDVRNEIVKSANMRMQNGYLYLIGTRGSYLFEGDDAKWAFDQFAPAYEQSMAEPTTLRGAVAFSGKVRGKVRVILDRRRAHELKDGEILVTTMTSPDFIQAMKKSSAIITNEGGVLCHAAIMAREFRKPCIINTKIATDVLHDGDLVEVDAVDGVVRILK